MDFELIAGLLAFAGFLAGALERLLEAFVASWLPDVVVALYERATGGNDSETCAKIRTWSMTLAAAVAGVVCAWGFGIDLVSPLAVSVGAVANPVLGYAVTGLIMGGGSNLVHMLFFGKNRLAG